MKTHISLNVTDVAASVDFYRRAFGAEPALQREDYAKFELDAPPLHLSVQLAPRTGTGRNASHFGVQLADSAAVRAARERIERAGIAARAEPDAHCCYGRQDKVWVVDPDGNAWEWFAIRHESDGRAPGSGANSADDQPCGAELGDGAMPTSEERCCAELTTAKGTPRSEPCCAPAPR